MANPFVPAREAVRLCEGILPPNDLSIPISPLEDLQKGGITEAQFNRVLDRLSEVFPSITIDRLWSSSQVNAYAMVGKAGEQLVVLHGGLARHPAVTEDGFLLIACHEVGHHYGGAPRRTQAPRSAWASVEGEADYYGTLKCLRRVWAQEDNAAALVGHVIPPAVAAHCRDQFPAAADQALCMRSSLAITSLTDMFADVAHEPQPDFLTPDPTQVQVTEELHPKAQCRMDTLFQGALCDTDPWQSLSGADPDFSTCNLGNDGNGRGVGMRPACWYRDPRAAAQWTSEGKLPAVD